VNRARQSYINIITQRMNKLSDEIAGICEEGWSSGRAVHLHDFQDRMQQRIDSIAKLSSDEPVGDLAVVIKMPPTDEPIQLSASWDSAANAFQIKNVPIELGHIVREINAELRDHQDSGLVRFEWRAVSDCVTGYSF